MKRLAPVIIAPLILLTALAACGSGDDLEQGPDAATAGEIQSLADAEAMLATREDTETDEEAGESGSE